MSLQTDMTPADTTPQALDTPSSGKKSMEGKTKASSKSARTRAREFAVQGLYQVLIGKNDVTSIDAFTRDLSGFNKCQTEHYDALLYGCAKEAAALDLVLTPCLDRPWAEISPIEHVVMWIGAYEYQFCLDVPWRVVLNECIELAKSFGGTDGHKYVNGVLHQLAGKLRPLETGEGQSHRRSKSSG